MQCHKFSIFNFHFSIKKGFTLIELMIVITLFGLATAMVTASYLTFERKERVRGVAQALKNNIRLVANRAHSGDKGFDKNDKCDTNRGHTLLGWYVSISTGMDTYSIAGNCLREGNEEKFAEETFTLSQDVHIVTISPDDEAVILYRPLSENATFHSPIAKTPDFFNASGVLHNSIDDSEISVTLQGPGGNRYQVNILKSGEVNEKKL